MRRAQRPGPVSELGVGEQDERVRFYLVLRSRRARRAALPGTLGQSQLKIRYPFGRNEAMEVPIPSVRPPTPHALSAPATACFACGAQPQAILREIGWVGSGMAVVCGSACRLSLLGVAVGAGVLVLSFAGSDFFLLRCAVRLAWMAYVRALHSRMTSPQDVRARCR